MKRRFRADEAPLLIVDVRKCHKVQHEEQALPLSIRELPVLKDVWVKKLTATPSIPSTTSSFVPSTASTLSVAAGTSLVVHEVANNVNSDHVVTYNQTVAKPVTSFEPSVLQCILSELRSGNELFVLQFSDDFVRDVLLAPLVNVAATDHGRHLPAEVMARFHDLLPTLAFFKDLATSSTTVDLLWRWKREFPSFYKELKCIMPSTAARSIFFTYVLSFVATLFISKEVRVVWNSESGYGLVANSDMVKGKVLQSCWGKKVTLSYTDLCFCFTHLSHTTHSYLTVNDNGVLKYTAVFGPIALINYSCKVCYNVTPFYKSGLSQLASMFPFSVPLEDLDFTVCTTTKELLADQELLLCFKPLGQFRCRAPGHAFVHSF